MAWQHEPPAHALATRLLRLRQRVLDPLRALDTLRSRAEDAQQRDQVLPLLDAILCEAAAHPTKFIGPPCLEILHTPWLALRAHGDFDDGASPAGPLVDPITGRPRRGHEQGMYLARTHERAGLAVLSAWSNPMDIVDVQQIPVGSVVLHGRAAPMQGVLRSSRRALTERLPGGAWQVAHIGQCPPHGPVSARRAERLNMGGYTTRGGRPMLPA